MSATTIRNRQIGAGEITNTHLAAGAAIATSKLADGSEFIKRDGSVLMTGNFDMNNNNILNVATPSASGHAVNKSYVDTAIGNLSSLYKYKSARVAMTSNVTISNPGTAVFDGVTLVSGERILLAGQTTQSQNGIYVFNGSGVAMTRATDADAWNEFPGASVRINEGTTYADTRFNCTSDDGGTLGSTAIVFSQELSSGLSSGNFVAKETPSGSINGSNTAFTLANTPTAGTEHLYLNGVLLESGSGNDYTISGASITMLTAPLTGEKLTCSYRK